MSQSHRHNIRRRLIDAACWSGRISAAAILDGSPVRGRHLGWVPSAFISTEEGVSPTTIISITPRMFTGFSHGLVCYKRQRFSYDTGRINLKIKIIIIRRRRIIVQSYLWKVIPLDLVSILRRKRHKILHSIACSPVDSDARLEWGDPTNMAATLDYVPARHEASTYIMSMVSPVQPHYRWLTADSGTN